MDDFQYLALSSDTELNKNSNDFSGPTFYIPPQCSVCALPCINLLCGSCVKRGNFYLSNRKKESGSFKCVCDEFRKNNAKLANLSKQILHLSTTNLDKRGVSDIADLEMELMRVKLDISNLERSISEKKEGLLRKRMDVKKCSIDKADINQKQIRLRECNVRLETTTKEVISQLIKTNKVVHNLRRENIRELFEKYLPIKASPTPAAELDSIAGVKLNVDSRNLTIPEPTISSHAALTLMIVAQRALTRIINACIPVDTRQIFSLNTFDVNAPTRDNITHVYRVVCQLIQVLAEISSRQAVSSESSKYAKAARDSRDRPLLALHYLVKSFKHDNFQSWTFDSPYILPSVDIFSAINYEIAMCPSHTGSNSLKHGIAVRVRRTGEILSIPSSGSFGMRNEHHSSSDSEWDIVGEID